MAEQHGGEIPPLGFNLSMSATSGVIYYTLNGADPRSVNGSPAGTAYTGPINIAPGMTVKARALSGGVWSALNEASYSQLSLQGDYDSNYVVARTTTWYGKTLTARLPRLPTAMGTGSLTLPTTQSGEISLVRA